MTLQAAVQVRIARGAEVDLAFGLMPHVANQGVPPAGILIAADAEDQVAGVAAFSLLGRDHQMPGLRAHLFVLPSQRRRGVGRALLRGLAAEAAQWDVDYLQSWQEWSDDEPPAFLLHLGAQRLRTLHYFEADAAAGHHHCSAFLARLRDTGRIPPGVRTENLQPHHWPAAAQLYALHSRTAATALQDHLAATCADAQNAALSFVLMLGEELIGLLLSQRDHGLPGVDLWITHPRYRHGWPALMLLQAASVVMLERGLPRCRFHCNDESRATLGMARRAGAELLHSRSSYALAI